MHRATLAACESAADAIRALQGVVAVDVVAQDPRFADTRHTIEVVVADYERVPPKVLREIANHDLGLWAVDREPASDTFRVVAV